MQNRKSLTQVRVLNLKKGLEEVRGKKRKIGKILTHIFTVKAERSPSPLTTETP